MPHLRLSSLVLILLLASGGLTAASGAGPPASAQPQAPPRLVPDSRFGWPLADRPAVMRRFERPPHQYGPGHRGVDLAGQPGQPVLAAADGVVGFAGPLAGRGVLAIDHDGGLRTTYEPVSASVEPAAVVRRGQVIGSLEPGHPGCQPAACLHWGVRRGEDYLDPLQLVGQTRVRLLPWEGAAAGQP